ncbi:MAG TPA: hypothetical protein VHD87_14130 [Acidimicrobiales bacterium]|nr:hypothetical protein [Acidimicrobiales bacterium]
MRRYVMPPMRGTLRTRLLLNAFVEPSEAASRLPEGLRPRVTRGGTLVGCCLLEIEDMRPGPFPARVGLGQLAAAHRVAVEWDAATGTQSGVFVVGRCTNSRVAELAGGRLAPGVFARAVIEKQADRWSVHGDGMDIEATVKRLPAEGSEVCDADAGMCIHADVGVSVGRGGALESAVMVPSTRSAIALDNVAFESSFIRGFASARPARSYLMRDVEVVWSRA